MFVMFASRIFGKENSLSLYKMSMDGLGKKVLIKKNFQSLKVLMDYDRDSKTLFVIDQLAGCIYSYSNEGLDFFQFWTIFHRWTLKYIIKLLN